MSSTLAHFLNEYTEVLNTNDVEKSGKQPGDIEMGRETVRIKIPEGTDTNQLKNEFANALFHSNAKKLLDGKSYSRDDIKSWFTYGKDMNIKFMALAASLGFVEITNPYKNSDIATKFAYSHKTSIKAVRHQEIPEPKTAEEEASVSTAETPALEVTGAGKEQQDTIAVAKEVSAGKSV